MTFKKFFASALFGFIAVVFVFVGLDPSQFGMGNDSGGAAAIVGENLISLREFEQAFENRQQQMEAQLSQLPAAQRQEQTTRMRDEVLDNLIKGEIQSLVAQDLGLVGSDDEVREYILKIPYLQKDGRFDRSRYDSLLTYLKQTPSEFEDRIRKEIKTKKLADLFTQAFKKVSTTSDPKNELKSIKANIRFVKIDETNLKSKVKISAETANAWSGDNANQAQLKDEYERRKLDFMDGERVKNLDEVKQEVAALILEKKAVEELKLKISKALLDSQEPNAIEEILKTTGVSWNKTGPFDLSAAQVPGLGSAESLMGSLNSKPIIGKVYPQIIAVDGSEALVIFDELKFGTPEATPKVDAANPFANFDFESMAMSSEAFDRWLKPKAEKIRVVKNQRIQVQ